MPLEMHFASENFVSLLQQRDEKTFLLIYDRYAAALYGEVIRCMGDGPEAETCLVLIFMQVYREIPTYDGTQRLLIWLLQVARRILRLQLHQSDENSL